MRLTRAQMLEVLRQDFVRTATAKGLAERAVVVRHALKNAFIPVLTLLGLQVSILVGGTVVLESVFVLPGHGPVPAGGGPVPRLPGHPGAEPDLRHGDHAGESGGRPALRLARPTGAIPMSAAIDLAPVDVRTPARRVAPAAAAVGWLRQLHRAQAARRDRRRAGRCCCSLVAAARP